MNGYKKEDILVGIFILAFICAVIFCCTSRNDVYDNGHGIDNVRDELEHAQAAQQEETRAIDETTRAIDRSQKAVTNSEERIETSQQTNREITDTERSDAEIIDECQSILARIRERGGKENQN